ncbi:hypothetical protein D3C76_1470610 [compost metagenome]
MNASQNYCQCFIQPIRTGFHQRGLIRPFGRVRTELIDSFGIAGNLITGQVLEHQGHRISQGKRNADLPFEPISSLLFGFVIPISV